MSKNYTVHFPENYQKVKFPGLNTWLADLQANPDKQCKRVLGKPEGPNCCLGRLSILQGRLDSRGYDDSNNEVLSWSNPYSNINGFSKNGHFPEGVSVMGICGRFFSFANLNDMDFSFAEIADIAEQIYENDGNILK